MAKVKLTSKQRRLVAEVRQLLSTLMLDPDAIICDEDVDGRTPLLELAKDQIIRSAVVSKYVLIRLSGRKKDFPVPSVPQTKISDGNCRHREL